MSRFLATALCLFLLIACTAPASKVPDNPQRIVSLRPNLTELLFALGAGDRVVGVTDYCVWPEQAKQLPKVGSYLFPDLETIFGLEPDLVVTNKESGTARFVHTLEEAGIPVLVLETRTLPDIFKTVTKLGKLLKRQDAASELTKQMQATLAEVKTQSENRPERKVLVVIQRKPLIVAGQKSYFNDVLQAAGAANAVPLPKVPYPQISMEEVLAWQPDAIIDIDPTSSLKSWRVYPALPAVQADRVFLLSPNLFRPGPRIGQAAQMIANALHEGPQ